jgi:hypothetical protein
MRYAVRSRMADEVCFMPKLLEEQPFLGVVWRAARMLIIGVCYLGVLIATPVVEFLAFNVLKWFRLSPPETGYWVSASVIIAGMFLGCYFAGLAVFQRLKGGCLDLDLAAMFIGTILAACLALWVLPTGL